MDAAMTRQLLAGDGDMQDIRARDSHSREMGVTGVPTFIVANKAVVSGAQPPKFWAEVISEYFEEQTDA